MPDTLYAWCGSRLVGKFTKSGDHIGFEYAPGYLQDGMTVEDLNRSLYNKELEYHHAETDYGKGLDGMFTQIRNFLNMVKKGQ